MAQANTLEKPARKPAPAGVVAFRPYTDERTELIHQYAPECEDKLDGYGREKAESKWVAYFGDEKEPVSRRKSMGFEPVIDPETKQQVTHNGDPLWRIPREKYAERIERPAAESREIVQDQFEAQDAEARSIGAYVGDENGPA